MAPDETTDGDQTTPIETVEGDSAIAEEQNERGDDGGSTRGRRITVRVLLTLGTIFFILAIFATWANRQLLNTDNWTDTSSQLLENPQINDAVANYLVDQAYANVDLAGELQARLPENLKPLAGPAAGALRGASDKVAHQLLQSPRIQAAWEDANRLSHQQFVNLVEDNSKFVRQNGNAVVLDLRPLLIQLIERIGLPSSVSNALPPSAGVIRVVNGTQLKTAQDAVKLFKTLLIVLVVLTLACYALALFLARGRRRQALMSIGAGVVIGGLVVLLVRSIAGGYVTDALTTTASVEPAANQIWAIGTGMLRTIAISAIVAGIPFLLVATLLGPSKAATGIRRWMAPGVRNRPEILYGVAVLLVLLFFVWGPIPTMRRPLTILIFLLVIVGGAWALHRQTVEEFPEDAEADGDTLTLKAGRFAQATRETASGAVTSLRQRSSDAPAASETGTTVATDRVAKLERLAALHDGGALDDEEFAREKKRLMDEDPGG